jgi:hypothetical protein
MLLKGATIPSGRGSLSSVLELELVLVLDFNRWSGFDFTDRR